MDGKLLGGFSIVPGKNLRVLESIKDKKKKYSNPRKCFRTDWTLVRRINSKLFLNSTVDSYLF